MNSTATPYRVPPEPGRWRAFALAMLMHALLLGFLWVGVSWQNTTPVAVEAEIWSPQARLAAPPPPPPAPEPEPQPEPVPKPPPPKPVAEPEPKRADPEIALEQERRRKQEQEKKQAEEQARREEQKKKQQQAEQEKQRLAELDKQKQAAEEKRRQEAAAEEKRRQEEEQLQQRAKKRREDELKRLQALAGEGTAGDAEKAASPKLDPGYARLIAAKIKSNTILPPLNDITGNPAVEYEIELLPDGSVRDVKLLRSSGSTAFDQAVRRAIDRSAPFPADPASKRVPGSLAISHRPKDQ